VSDDGLRALLRKNLRGVHWTTIETGAAQRGVPDLHGCCDGGFWVECKSVRRGWRIKFQPSQVGWLLTEERHGGRTFVAVRRRVKAADELWLFSGQWARELHDDDMREALVFTVESGGPARWDWSRVAELLGAAS
jgi:hypothetical protein